MPAPDVLVVGGGLSGLTAALACADRGLNVTLVGDERPGAASGASAGVLGPSIGRGPKSGRVGRFMFAARDRYPAYLEQLRERSGIHVGAIAGALELALNETHLAELRSRARKLPDSSLLDSGQAAALEPSLVRVAGALHHPGDGSVDVSALVSALLTAILAHPRIARINARVCSLVGATTVAPGVVLADGGIVRAPHVVLAAGAWVAGIGGVPRVLPVRPVKGEIAMTGAISPLRHVVFGAGGYLVPRGGDLLVGATSNEAGFDAEPTDHAALELRNTARTLLRDWPDAAVPFASQRTGLRPMTPDGYPILGRDADAPALLFACGYSRNGVLISPLAAECLAALIVGEDPGHDLTAFSASRFAG